MCHPSLLSICDSLAINTCKGVHLPTLLDMQWQDPEMPLESLRGKKLFVLLVAGALESNSILTLQMTGVRDTSHGILGHTLV